MAAASSSTPPLGKYLSSTEKATRDKAIQSLAVFLSEPANARMSPGDMAKLWKGIFYCFWMSDKPLVQQALASELAGLLLAIDSTDAALGFLKGFWTCMVREWSGIDRLRMDKYYMLIRRYVNASFQLLARAGWEVADVEAYNEILTRQGGPLCPTDPRVPPSLAYHICDIYLAELEKVLASASSSEEEEEADEDRNLAPLPVLLSPFVSLAARTPTKATVQRVQDAVLTPLLSALASSLSPSPAQSDEDEDGRRAKRRRVDDDEYGDIVRGSCTGVGEGAGSTGARALHGSVMKLVWDTATKEDARDANRRRLYAFWKQNGLDDESI
ncbi:Nop52-domain-containing protein [Peniophora sp. CONT]|nr:Nop52-domain-containing protein [Peniophora sp. CONT]